MIDYLHVLLPIIGLIINVFVQIFGVRYIPGLTLLKSVIAGFVVGSISVIGLACYLWRYFPILPQILLGLMTTNFLIYSGLGYCYFHFINLGETARRIRILRELCETPEGLSQEEILERYNAKHIVDMRLRRLLDNGQIVERQGRYYIGSPVMLFIAKSIIALKFVILGKRSEFD
jgi:hypothetical protein